MQDGRLPELSTAASAPPAASSPGPISSSAERRNRHNLPEPAVHPPPSRANLTTAFAAGEPVRPAWRAHDRRTPPSGDAVRAGGLPNARGHAGLSDERDTGASHGDGGSLWAALLRHAQSRHGHAGPEDERANATLAAARRAAAIAPAEDEPAYGRQPGGPASPTGYEQRATAVNRILNAAAVGGAAASTVARRCRWRR